MPGEKFTDSAGNSMDIRKKGFLLSKKWCIITGNGLTV